MNRKYVVSAALFAAACFAFPCAAQMTPSVPGGGPVTGPTGPSSGDNTYNEIDRTIFRYNLEQKRLQTGKTAAELKAIDIADASALVNSVQFACEVTDAELVLEGSDTVDGKAVKTKTYEAACGNGLGYFFVAGTAHPTGMTCFAADATRAADIKAGRAPANACALPENADIKTIAANFLQRAGKTCQVRDLRWIGVSPKSNTDFTEVACSDGNGFIVASPLPGSTLKPRIAQCHDAAMQGMPCKLSDNGQVLTVQTFKDALAQHNVVCDASDVRVVGKESVAKRHVVEFACKQHPEGLVAYIPLEDGTAPFETVDCAAAAKRGVTCKLTTPH